MARTKDPHAATVKAWKTRARNRKANMEATATALAAHEGAGLWWRRSQGFQPTGSMGASLWWLPGRRTTR